MAFLKTYGIICLIVFCCVFAFLFFFLSQESLDSQNPGDTE